MKAPVPAAAEEGCAAAGGLGQKPQRVQGRARRESRGQSPLALAAEARESRGQSPLALAAEARESRGQSPLA